MASFKCSKCSYNTPRNYDLTRHLKRVHGVSKNTDNTGESSDEVRQLESRMLSAGISRSEESYPSMNSHGRMSDIQDGGHYGKLHRHQAKMVPEENEDSEGYEDSGGDSE